MSQGIRIISATVLLVHPARDSCRQLNEGGEEVSVYRHLEEGVDEDLCVCDIETAKDGAYNEDIFAKLFQHAPQCLQRPVWEDLETAVCLEAMIQRCVSSDQIAEFSRRVLQSLERGVPPNPAVISLEWGFWVIPWKATDPEWRPWLLFVFQDQWKKVKHGWPYIRRAQQQAFESLIAVRRLRREWEKNRREIRAQFQDLQRSEERLKQLCGEGGSDLEAIEKLILESAELRSRVHAQIYQLGKQLLDAERALMNLEVALRYLEPGGRDGNRDPHVLRFLRSPVQVFREQLKVDSLELEHKLREYDQVMDCLRTMREIQSQRLERDINWKLLIIALITLIGIRPEIEKLADMIPGLPPRWSYSLSLVMVMAFSLLISGGLRRLVHGMKNLLSRVRSLLRWFLARFLSMLRRARPSRVLHKGKGRDAGMAGCPD